MKLVAILILICQFFSANAQVKINLSVQTPPINEAIFNGKFLKAYQLYEYTAQKNFISPGIEFDNLFSVGPAEAKLHYSLGFYYSSSDFIGVHSDSDQNEFVSEIKAQMINMPLLARGSVKVSDLIDNNRIGIELGVITTAWLKYELDEIASIKSKDIDGNIIGETIYSDKGNLVTRPADKINLKAIFGLFVYVNRFYLSFRMDLLSFGDLYSNRLNQAWKIPAEYSFYQQTHKEGRMKRTYANLTISFRISR
jgi:hypothetical protein